MLKALSYFSLYYVICQMTPFSNFDLLEQQRPLKILTKIAFFL